MLINWKLGRMRGKSTRQTLKKFKNKNGFSIFGKSTRKELISFLKETFYWPRLLSLNFNIILRLMKMSIHLRHLDVQLRDAVKWSASAQNMANKFWNIHLSLDFFIRVLAVAIRSCDTEHKNLKAFFFPFFHFDHLSNFWNRDLLKNIFQIFI